LGSALLPRGPSRAKPLISHARRQNGRGFLASAVAAGTGEPEA